ncbi:MAG: molybdenum cofactor carrier protein [Sandaracinaceae bacterium]|nr:molybdenum cofactor carrier protein [Sandaracinaceae bacterium]
MGSGREPHTALAAPLGVWIAREGHHLLTGGGGGVMEAVSAAFVATRPRVGVCIGVLPGPDARPGYPNPHVEIPIRTHLPLSGALGTDPRSRNHVNVLSSDVIVALPGGEGTRSEVALAARYGRLAVLFGPREAFWEWPRAAHAERLEDVARFVAAASAPLEEPL